MPELLLFNVPLDTVTVPQARLDISDKERSNPLAWRGQFSPQLVQVLLEVYAPAEGGVVLDPFMGSGTVLYEAGREGFSAIGAEVNPAAVILARTYTLINTPVQRRERVVDRLDERLSSILPDTPSLWQRSVPPIPDSEVPQLLLSLRDELEEPGEQTLIETLILMSKLGEADLSSERVHAVWRRLRSLVRRLPFSNQPLLPTHADARKLPCGDHSVDLVITSPPYINVFNYHQQYRKATEALGYDLLTVARSEIGSNRKHRGNRFLTVIQFCLDIVSALEELRRVCRRGARIVFVVGRESMVLRTPFYNGAILAELAVCCTGFTLESRQERQFVNRFGERIYEDLLHLRAGSPQGGATHPINVAVAALRAALDRAPDESRRPLEAAISAAEAVAGSPLLSVEE